MTAVSEESMPPLNPSSTLLEAALADVVAGAQHQRFIDRFALVGEVLPDIPGAGLGVHHTRSSRKEAPEAITLPSGVHGEAAAVKNELVVPADLVDVHHGSRCRRAVAAKISRRRARLPM